MNYKNIHIAVIDDGVNSQYFDGISLKYDIEITRELEIKERLIESPYYNSHGTTCVAIIRKYYKKGIISSIKILDENDLGNKQKLTKAIEWCIDNNIDIVHLSIGSVYYGDKKEIQEIIDKANDFGLLIVAANKNEDVITYPAYFHNAIGVKCQSYKSLKEGEYIYTFKPLDGIEITSCGSHLLKNYKGKQYTTQNCNSFAAPMITAIVAEIIEKLSNYSIELIQKLLWERSSNYKEDMSFYRAYNSLEWIKSALIFTTYKSKLSVKNYIFDIKKMVNINIDTEDEIFNQIDDYLNYNTHVLNDIDTIILELDVKIYDGFTENGLSQLLNHYGLYEKSIVLINPELSNIDIVRFCNNNIKSIYYNPISHSDYMELNYAQEKPIILIYNKKWYKTLNFLFAINNELLKRGYNPVIFTDDIRGIYSGYYHFLIEEKTFDYDVQVNEKINSFISIYSGDIGLIGLSDSSIKNKLIEKIREVFDIDLVILEDVNSENVLFNQLVDTKNTIILSDYKLDKNSFEAVVDRILEMYGVGK